MTDQDNIVYSEDWTGNELVEIGGPSEPAPPSQYLAMNGTSDSLRLPAMTMDTIELDILVDSTPIEYRYIVDARSGSTYYSRVSDRNSLQNNGFVATGFILDERMTLVLKAKAFTDNVNIFSRNDNYQRAKGKLYKITCYLDGTIVAQYDMSLGNVQDQSGNENHATLNGGTWIQV